MATSDFEQMSDEELMAATALGIRVGVEPAARFTASVELRGRLMLPIRQLRAETPESGRKVEKLTRWLVRLTVGLTPLTVVLVVLAIWA